MCVCVCVSDTKCVQLCPFHPKAAIKQRDVSVDLSAGAGEVGDVCDVAERQRKLRAALILREEAKEAYHARAVSARV